MTNGMRMIEKLDSSNFTYDNYETNWWSRLEMDGWDINDRPLIESLKIHAIGFCNSNSLSVRPRESGYAIMCEDEDFEKFWFHISDRTFEDLMKEMTNEIDQGK